MGHDCNDFLKQYSHDGYRVAKAFIVTACWGIFVTMTSHGHLYCDGFVRAMVYMMVSDSRGSLL